MFLGAVSDTLDREGKILKTYSGAALKKKEIQKRFNFSRQARSKAADVSAKKSAVINYYDLARAGN